MKKRVIDAKFKYNGPWEKRFFGSGIHSSWHTWPWWLKACYASGLIGVIILRPFLHHYIIAHWK